VPRFNERFKNIILLELSEELIHVNQYKYRYYQYYHNEEILKAALIYISDFSANSDPEIKSELKL